MVNESWNPFTSHEKVRPAITLCRRVHGMGEIKFLKTSRDEYLEDLCGSNHKPLVAFVNDIDPDRSLPEPSIRQYLEEFVLGELDQRKVMLPDDLSGEYPIIEFVYQTHVLGQQRSGTQVEQNKLFDALVNEFIVRNKPVVW